MTEQIFKLRAWWAILPPLILTLIFAGCASQEGNARCAPQDAVVYSVFTADEVADQPDLVRLVSNEMNDAQVEYPTGQVSNCTNSNDGPNPGGLAVYVIP